MSLVIKGKQLILDIWPEKPMILLIKIEDLIPVKGIWAFSMVCIDQKFGGLNLTDYVKLENFIKSIQRIKEIGKNAIIAKFKESAKNIYKLLNYSNQRGQIPLIKDGKEVFDKYIEGRAKFIEDRLDYLYKLDDIPDLNLHKLPDMTNLKLETKRVHGIHRIH